MTDMTEIKGLVEKVNEALIPLRTEVDAIKTRDSLDEAKFDKMAAEVTGAMEKLQAIEQKNAALEAALQRGDMAGNDDAAKEAEAKGHEAIREFVRKGSRREPEIATRS